MRQQPDLCRELDLWACGHSYIAGIDEAGRGAWAGPVVAAACVLPANADDLLEQLSPVCDSKMLSPRQRARCYELIMHCALTYGVGVVSAAEIDRIGILPATRAAMVQAVSGLALQPDYLLIDAVKLPALAIPQRAAPKSDVHILSVAAASIIAKVTRDRLLAAMDAAWPGYGLSKHKGYGTAAHLAALRALGTSCQHRHSYAPVRAIDEAQNARS